MALVLVYNADSGLFNALTDSVHRLVAPASYDCRLCQTTHHTFGMLRPWRDFLTGLDAEVAFYHRDEFHQAYGRLDLALPAILWDEGGRVEPVVPAEAIERLAAGPDPLAGLTQAVRAALAERAA